MSVDLLIANFLRLASEDLEGAELLAARDNRNAIDLCEQAAEKIIRAVLTSESKHAGTRHMLDQMVDQVPDENPMKPLLRAIEDLTPYATTYRYPTPAARIPNAPTPEQFAAFAGRVRVALDRAVREFDVPLAARGTPARKPVPVR